ncbi:MAG: porin family protein [Rhizobiaceae bacterium]|nr:porin family protein [Rhizobiaceae bacterium]
MRSLKNLSLVTAALLASSAMAQAADLIPAPVEELPPEISHVSPVVGGWYIRGDIGYASVKLESDTRFFQGPSQTGVIVGSSDNDETWFLQGGIGYQVNDYLRVDATLAYYDDADASGTSGQNAQCNFAPLGTLCNFNDDQEFSQTVLMANAYVDLGTISGFTPYVGAGIGGAHIDYTNLRNTQECLDPLTAPPGVCGLSEEHRGEAQWRFAWALHAGASYDVNCRTKIDAGYTFTRIEGGRAFGFTSASGFSGTQGFDQGIDSHSGRIGLRYALSDAGCGVPPVVPPVVYK